MVIRTLRASTNSVSRVSDRCARRSGSGPFVGGTDLCRVYSQDSGEPFGYRLAQRCFPQLEAAERCRRDADLQRQLGLGQAGLDAQIAQVPLVRGDAHQFGHRNIERGGDTGQTVHLRGGLPGFPGAHGGHAHFGEPRQVATGVTLLRPQLDQPLPVESPKRPPCHAQNLSTSHNSAVQNGLRHLPPE